MAIPKNDLDKMRRLAQEGKTIASIWRDDFHETYDYWDTFWAILGTGECSALGVKRAISNRLNKLETCSAADRRVIVQELHELVWHLYKNSKVNQAKLERIRKALGE